MLAISVKCNLQNEKQNGSFQTKKDYKGKNYKNPSLFIQKEMSRLVHFWLLGIAIFFS